MKTVNDSLTTITLEHILPHETIGDLTKRACLLGKTFKISITVEEPNCNEKQIESGGHPLANYFINNHPFDGLSEKINRATRDIRDGMSEKLFDKLAK